MELEGVTNVVDFTRTVFSVDDQSYIHLVCENESGKAEIRQFFIEQSFTKEDKFIGKIDLVETKIQEIQILDALRVFQIN